MTNFKITGKTHESTKSHYVVEKNREQNLEHRVDSLAKKIVKHAHLPMEKAHQSDQKDAPLPHMRKY